jgi:hypothetical protein
MALKPLSVQGKTTILEWFTIYEVVSEYVKSLERLEEYKRLRRIRQEYFALYEEYADRHKIKPISSNFRPKPKKKLDPKSPS